MMFLTKYFGLVYCDVFDCGRLASTFYLFKVSSVQIPSKMFGFVGLRVVPPKAGPFARCKFHAHSEYEWLPFIKFSRKEYKNYSLTLSVFES